LSQRKKSCCTIYQNQATYPDGEALEYISSIGTSLGGKGDPISLMRVHVKCNPPLLS
jgi:hypothetical protein